MKRHRDELGHLCRCLDCFNLRAELALLVEAAKKKLKAKANK